MSDEALIPDWVEIVVKLTPAFFTMVVGLVASYVAFLNYRTNADKLRLELFAKRQEAFEKVHEYLTHVFRAGRVNDESLPLLVEARYKSRFLFGDSIEASLDELWSKSFELRGLYNKLYGQNALAVGPERNAVCLEEAELLKWHNSKLRTAHELYAPYMRFKR